MRAAASAAVMAPWTAGKERLHHWRGRLQHPHALRHGQRFRDGAGLEVPCERLRVRFRFDQAAGKDGAHFGREEEPVALLRIVERFDAEGVAREEAALLALVPECEREHAAQWLHAIRAVLFVEPEDHLRVAARVEDHALALEIGSQFGEVVDLPVENNGEPPVGGGHRLVASGAEVEHRETCVGEAGRALLLRPNSGVIRAAVPHRQLHAAQRGCRAEALVGRQNSRNAAHGIVSLGGVRQRIRMPGRVLAPGYRRLGGFHESPGALRKGVAGHRSAGGRHHGEPLFRAEGGGFRHCAK